MSPERILALTLAFVFLMGISAAGRLRRRADLEGGKVSRTRDGVPTATLIGVAAVSFYLGLLAWLIQPRWMAWSQVSLPWTLRWTGLGLVVMGFGGAYWSLRHLGRNVTPTSAVRPGARLVTSGPYRWVRHPLYTCFTLIALGVGLTTASVWIAAAAALAWTVVIARTRREEANLRAAFGEAYDRYSRRTGRLLPRFFSRGSESASRTP